MRGKVALFLVFLVTILAGTSALAQYDMRNPNNPYAGMGRTGFALEDRSKALQQQKEQQQAKKNPIIQNNQGKSSQTKKQPNKK
jgi:hypothetical protein|uniref:Uncharacterized protein n=1 Tax=Desulfobacca acetoxidans TaxID=60893 RepID=A0A7V6A3X7_9BACT